MINKNLAAFGMALVAGYMGYAVVNVQWELLLSFPIVAVPTFAILVREESTRKVVGRGLYILAALLFFFAVHYTVYSRGFLAEIVGFNILFAVAVIRIGWIVLAAVAVAVAGVKLNQSTKE